MGRWVMFVGTKPDQVRAYVVSSAAFALDMMDRCWFVAPEDLAAASAPYPLYQFRVFYAGLFRYCWHSFIPLCREFFQVSNGLG
jgi:hypothetical protein